jgi:type IV pilus assembly protein PilQ
MKKIITALFFITLSCVAFADVDAKVTMDFRDTDVREVFKIIANKIDMGMVIEKSVRGQITLTIKSTQARDALDLISEASGYAWEQRGNNIFVTVAPLLSKKIKAFRLNYIDIEEAAKVLSQTVSGDIKIATCKHIDSLVISAEKEAMNEAMLILSLIDRKPVK